MARVRIGTYLISCASWFGVLGSGPVGVGKRTQLGGGGGVENGKRLVHFYRRKIHKGLITPPALHLFKGLLPPTPRAAILIKHDSAARVDTET